VLETAAVRAAARDVLAAHALPGLMSADVRSALAAAGHGGWPAEAVDAAGRGAAAAGLPPTPPETPLMSVAADAPSAC
jgi:hypothetical protein